MQYLDMNDPLNIEEDYQKAFNFIFEEIDNFLLDKDLLFAVLAHVKGKCNPIIISAFIKVAKDWI